MAWRRSKGDARPSLRGSLSADAASQHTAEPSDARSRESSLSTLAAGDPGNYLRATPGDGQPMRRASSFVHFKGDTAASSTTLVAPSSSKSSQELKRRQPYSNGDNSPKATQGAHAGNDPKGSKEGDLTRRDSVPLTGPYKHRISLLRRQSREIFEHVEPYEDRVNFILILAQALLAFGAPSHRIESQLESAAAILKITVSFIHMPGLIIANLMDRGTMVSETRFVRAGGRIALTALHRVHLVYRDVLHDKVGVREGTDRLRKLLRARPIYPIWIRCLYAFICASIICTTAFGGSLLDMFISGLSAAVLQLLGLRVATKSAMYANVYEISVSIIVSFIARLLGTLRGNLFCYSAISSAGVVLILPGFTILVSALELTSRNITCGSLRMVYAFIYTLFLGFGLTFGSEVYLSISKYGRNDLGITQYRESEYLHGQFLSSNTTSELRSLEGSFKFLDVTTANSRIVKGCYRDPSWPWWRQPFPFWTLFFLVPIYALCSSLSNLQRIRSVQLIVMVVFSCASYATTKAATLVMGDRVTLISALGALAIGLCGNIWSRLGGGTAFTSMITGVLFLVPSAIGNGGGLISNYKTAAQQYSDTFQLGLRMIQVASGVTIGLFMAQILVYALGRRKNAAYFAF